MPNGPNRLVIASADLWTGCEIIMSGMQNALLIFSGSSTPVRENRHLYTCLHSLWRALSLINLLKPDEAIDVCPSRVKPLTYGYAGAGCISPTGCTTTLPTEDLIVSKRHGYGRNEVWKDIGNRDKLDFPRRVKYAIANHMSSHDVGSFFHREIGGHIFRTKEQSLCIPSIYVSVGESGGFGASNDRRKDLTIDAV